MSEFKRALETWEKCDPKAMSAMSQTAIYYGFSDAQADIVKLHRQLAALREELSEKEKTWTARFELICEGAIRPIALERNAAQEALKAAEQRNAEQLKLISLIRKTIPAAGMGASWSVDLCDRIDRLINPQPARCVNCDRATVEQCDDAGCGFLGAGNGAPDAKPTESGASE